MSPAALQPLLNPFYSIKNSLIIAQSAEMRVIDQTLAPGECVPWHLHPHSDDYIICLRGELQVREINPPRLTTLLPLDRHRIEKGQAHSTANAGDQDCQFLIVQGPGQVEFCPLPSIDAHTTFSG